MGAGVTRYVVRNDKDGNPRVIRSDEVIPFRSGETLESMEKRVMKDLYHLECKQGSRFNGIGEFSPATLKRVWAEENV